MKELICIVCPKGCHLQVDENNDYAVSGNSCARGAEYGRAELTNPTRVVTSTVAVEGGTVRRCPVKTSTPIPKSKIFEVMRQINGIRLTGHISPGQVLVENICGTGASLVATCNGHI